VPHGYLRPLILQVEEGHAPPRRLAFLRSPVRIGRDPALELALQSAVVSGRHGVLQFDDADAWYTDLVSRNGTLMDGVPVRPGEPVRLGERAVLRIGPVHLTVERGAAQPAAEAAASGAIRPGALTALLSELARTPEVAPEEAWAASLHPGLVVGRFELLRELGRGGFGVVYEARDRQLGRRVALKALRAGGALTGGETDDWLLREAEAAAQLCHPHVVQLFDAGTWEGGPYLIYELLRGEGLEVRLARGPLPPAEALQVAVEVAGALAHAHAAGVVHRDLKPGNVFLTEAAGAKVLDFGLAQVLGQGLEGGTPRYMAPEQLDRRAQDARTDVFAAALVLRESWLGPNLPDAVLREAAPLPGAPERLGRLVASALATAPDSRPGDGAAWLDGLLAAQRAA
jgi:hypothetical protein